MSRRTRVSGYHLLLLLIEPVLAGSSLRARTRILARYSNIGFRPVKAPLSSRVPQLTLVTQNVDGLQQRAGSPSVAEHRGNILRERCVAGQVIAGRSRESGGDLPRCASCGGLPRPDVVLQGPSLGQVLPLLLEALRPLVP